MPKAGPSMSASSSPVTTSLLMMKKRKLESKQQPPVPSNEAMDSLRCHVLEGRNQGIRKVISGCCQVESCGADLRNAKPYHRRHRVCENHAKAQFVLVSGIRQRFCQQCSRFHHVTEFDESKRSCRKRLAGHNERRRKLPAETTTDKASSSKRMACGQVNIQDKVSTTTYSIHFQINKVANAPSLLS